MATIELNKKINILENKLHDRNKKAKTLFLSSLCIFQVLIDFIVLASIIVFFYLNFSIDGYFGVCIFYTLIFCIYAIFFDIIFMLSIMIYYIFSKLSYYIGKNRLKINKEEKETKENEEEK